MTYEELLPATKSSRHSGIRYTPADSRGGMLVILSDRSTDLYAVTMFDTSWDGIAFHFQKASPGTDKGEAAYDVFVCHRSGGQNRRCDCKGFTRWGTCKHVDAALALVSNGWLPREMVNAEQDTACTECPF